MVPATAGGTVETPVVTTGQIFVELLNTEFELPVVPALAGGIGSRPVVPVNLFLAFSTALSRLHLRTPVVAPVVPAGVLNSSINSSLLFSNRWFAHSSYSTSEKTFSKLCLTHFLSL